MSEGNAIQFMSDATKPIVRARRLMHHSMPPFEDFLEQTNKLEEECERAGDLNSEKKGLFTKYRTALLDAREEYEDAIAQFICAHFTSEEIDQLIAFYEGPLSKVIEKALALGPTVADIGTTWRTKVLERCPDTWKMFIECAGRWQEKNSPEGTTVALPESPNEAEGWRKVDREEPRVEAEEFPEPNKSA